jgi:hypothetical protein
MSVDLTRRPPRSMRVRLGGFVILARMLDKGRATLAKKNGEYNYNSLPIDSRMCERIPQFDRGFSETGGGKC